MVHLILHILILTCSNSFSTFSTVTLKWSIKFSYYIFPFFFPSAISSNSVFHFAVNSTFITSPKFSINNLLLIFLILLVLIVFVFFRYIFLIKLLLLLVNKYLVFLFLFLLMLLQDLLLYILVVVL